MTSMGLVLASAWILMLATFSVPGREGPSSIGALDWIALLKLGTRAVVLMALMLVLVRRWSLPKRPTVVATMRPFALFALWAMASAAWSPLPAMSLGQGFSLSVLVVLSAAVAMLWQEAADTDRMVRHLSAALLLISAALLAFHVADPQLAGINRSWDEGGALGVMHPTSAGATASLGLVLVVSVLVIWRPSWPRAMLTAAVFVHPAVLLIAISRTALGLAGLALALAVGWMGPRIWLAAAGLAAAAVVYPVVDPDLDAAAVLFRSAVQYGTRGESVETLRTLTGRTELWSVVLASVADSPVIGYGYHVASSDGIVDAMGGPAYRTAHNLVLHVLASTGLVGLGLFLWALWRPLRRAAVGLGADAEGRRMRRLLVVLGSWYAGWSLLSESFMGPLQPESVLFFSVLGLAVGQACDRP